jgi:hypothetical protein
LCGLALTPDDILVVLNRYMSLGYSKNLSNVKINNLGSGIVRYGNNGCIYYRPEDAYASTIAVLP